MVGKGWLVVAVLFLLVLLVAVAAPLVFFPRGGGYGWGMGPWMSGGWGMMGMMFLGPILVLLVIGLAVAGTVLLVQSTSRGGQRAAGAAGDTPLDILKRRYAGGEITKDQFEEMRRTLAP
jgi:putative membrane protein